MKKVLIFGNSGSGKSTLAKTLCEQQKLAHLDLDTLAWQASSPPARKPLAESKAEILAFIKRYDSWVIEGCYADLLGIAAPFSNQAIYLNLAISDCIANAKNRPWEPHKYKSKTEQDKNLDMLIDWIQQYTTRTDEFSEQAHKKLYDNYHGEKQMRTQNTPII